LLIIPRISRLGFAALPEAQNAPLAGLAVNNADFLRCMIFDHGDGRDFASHFTPLNASKRHDVSNRNSIRRFGE